MKHPTNFEITKPSNRRRTSKVYGSACVRGLALGAHATDDATFILAGDTNFQGFVTREVKAEGPGLREAVLGVGNDDRGIVNAFKAGGQVSVEDPDELEIEGTDYIVTTGTGEQIDANSAVGTQIGWANGKAQEVQAGQIATHKIIANSAIAGSTLDSVNGGIRLRLARL